MDKKRQQELSRWLRQQAAPARMWLRISSILGLITALIMVVQAWTLATLLEALITQHQPRDTLLAWFFILLMCFTLRAFLILTRERAGFRCGQSVRQALRNRLLNHLTEAGPAWIQGKPAGSWGTLVLEQIEDMQEYYSRYLPQMTLAVLIPCSILLAIFPINWAAGIILLTTAPLIPLFMVLTGLGAADANRRNFVALERLSGQFLDRLRGLDTLRLFNRGKAEVNTISQSTDEFRRRTMDVLRLAFLSSAVLEFFASVSIAVAAVYFGFSYLGELNFGSYGTGVTLFAGFLTLILAPEFFQPLRDLGTFYHAKAQAMGSAEMLERLLRQPLVNQQISSKKTLPPESLLTLIAKDLLITTPTGDVLAGPLNFQLKPGDRVAIIGLSGSGKTTLFNALMGFLPYRGSLTVNDLELSALDKQDWMQRLVWVGQNPHLPAKTLRENLLQAQHPDEQRLESVLTEAGIREFMDTLPNGLETIIDEQASGLSVGQAQRVALARALLKPAQLMLLDEPTASLDTFSEGLITTCLLAASQMQTTLLITHQLEKLAEWQHVWVMHEGQIVQQGTLQTLKDENGFFTDLFGHRLKDANQ